jgi:ABC-type dipeptide/oligopeptide/nickel transport system ATPase component
MRQRIMIRLALILNPRLIIADEPTNSLDVIVEAHFLHLLKSLQKEYNLTILLSRTTWDNGAAGRPRSGHVRRRIIERPT